MNRKGRPRNIAASVRARLTQRAGDHVLAERPHDDHRALHRERELEVLAAGGRVVAAGDQRVDEELQPLHPNREEVRLVGVTAHHRPHREPGGGRLPRGGREGAAVLREEIDRAEPRRDAMELVRRARSTLLARVLDQDVPGVFAMHRCCPGMANSLASYQSARHRCRIVACCSTPRPLAPKNTEERMRMASRTASAAAM